MKPYNKSNIPLAKNLRKNMTPWERKLWYDYLRYYPVRFQRQKAIGEFIVDFYCAKARLVIELDGSGHYEPKQEQADAIRTHLLEKMNLSVLRICNLDVDRNFSGVCEYIDTVVQKALPQSASLTAPSPEGAISQTAQQQTIYALGFFDGVHLGHQALLSACRQLAEHDGFAAGAVTFLPHPETAIPGKTPGLINTVTDRKQLLCRFGAKTVVELPFDDALRSMHWRDFIRMLRNAPYNAVGFVCGADFHFGHKGEGTAQILQEYCHAAGMPCAIVPEQQLSGIRISSTHIRSLLEQGDVAQAAAFLGHPHTLTGTVVAGRGLGRTIGIPTANLVLPPELIQPKLGVYACTATANGKTYPAVTNIGCRPTVGGHHITVEPWLLDFDGDLYGKEITLDFYKFLRPETKFDSLEALRTQIQLDAAQTYKILQEVELCL